MKKKSLVGWTYYKWIQDFKWRSKDTIGIPTWILNTDKNTTGLIKIRITIEEIK